VRTIDQRIRIFGSEVYVTVRDTERRVIYGDKPGNFHGTAPPAPPRARAERRHDPHGTSTRAQGSKIAYPPDTSKSNVKAPKTIGSRLPDARSKVAGCSFQVPSPRHSVSIQPNAVWLFASGGTGGTVVSRNTQCPSRPGAGRARSAGSVQLVCSVGVHRRTASTVN
jgi:hypothetical protein